MQSIRQKNHLDPAAPVRALFLTGVVFLWAAVTAMAQDPIRFYGETNGYDEQVLPNYLMLSDQRLLIDLAGDWQVIIDGKTRTAKVPSNYDYRGRVIYRRTFTAGPEFRGRHFQLVAMGINYKADIRINGVFIGNQNGGYLPFRYDLNEDLIKIDEPNTIEIIVDSELDVKTTIPKRSSILQPAFYGGIFREIFLVAVPVVAVENYRLDYTVSPDLKRCEFKVNLHIRNYGFGYQRRDTTNSGAVESRKTRLRYVVEVFNEEDPEPVYSNRFKKYRFSWEAPKIREFNDENVVEFDHYTSAEAEFTLEKPTYWYLDTPYRYRVVISLYEGTELIDQVRTLIGLCRVEVSDQYILVNNRPLPVKGVIYYEDYPGAGNTLPMAVMEDDVLRMKKLGINVVYFKHHPPHPYFLELCNRYGLMTFCEVPISIITPGTIGDQAYMEDFKIYGRSFVERYRHNVCILAWGLGAGLDQGVREAERFVDQVVDAIRSADGRPVFCNLLFAGAGMRLDNVDIINLDLRTNDLITAGRLVLRVTNQYPHKPILALYGAQIFSNNQNGYADPMSTKFQTKFITDVYKKIPEWKLTGGLIRSFNDFRTNRSHIYANPNGDPTVLTTGLVTHDRKERLAYDVVKALYTDDRTDVVVMGTYENTYPKTYPVVGLILVVLFVSFYRQSDKFKSSVFRSITKIYNFYSDIRDNRVIALWAALVVGVVSSLALAMLVSMVLFELRRNQVFDEFLANVIASNATKAWVDHMAWRPETAVILFACLFVLAHIVIAAMIKLFSYAFQSHVSIQQSIIGAFWSGSHYLFLVPLVILFHRLLRYDFLLSATMIVTVFMILWHFVRWFRIVRIMYDTSWWKVAGIVGGLTVVVIFSMSLYYSYYFDFYGTLELIRRMYASQNYSFQ